VPALKSIPTAADTQTTLTRHGFQLDEADYIVMDINM
jgi:hypothetical protein